MLVTERRSSAVIVFVSRTGEEWLYFLKVSSQPYLALMCMYMQTNLPWRSTENAGFDETPGGGGGEMQRASTVAGVFLKHLCCLNETQAQQCFFFLVVPAKTSTGLLIFFCTKFWHVTHVASLELWTWMNAQIVWLTEEERLLFFLNPIDLHWKRATQMSKERTIIENYGWAKKQPLIGLVSQTGFRLIQD